MTCKPLSWIYNAFWMIYVSQNIDFMQLIKYQKTHEKMNTKIFVRKSTFLCFCQVFVCPWTWAFFLSPFFCFPSQSGLIAFKVSLSALVPKRFLQSQLLPIFSSFYNFLFAPFNLFTPIGSKFNRLDHNSHRAKILQEFYGEAHHHVHFW